MRYAAYTFGGCLLFSAASAQGIGDKVADYLQRDARPCLGYTFDNAPGAYPFTFWKHYGSALVGTPYATFDEVAKHWGA